MKLHRYRCPRCQATVHVRHRDNPDPPVVVTCQASTYCERRGVVMLREDGDT